MKFNRTPVLGIGKDADLSAKIKMVVKFSETHH